MGWGTFSLSPAQAKATGVFRTVVQVVDEAVAEGAGGVTTGRNISSNSSCNSSRNRSRSRSNISRHSSSRSDHIISNSRSAVMVVVMQRWLGWSGAAMERRMERIRRQGARYGGGRAQADWGGGRGLPSYTPPPHGYDYYHYPPNLLPPVGKQPSTHGADPRKRCQTCNKLGYAHPFCACRVDLGHPRPPGTVPPRPGGTVPGGRLPPPSALNRQQS